MAQVLNIDAVLHALSEVGPEDPANAGDQKQQLAMRNMLLSASWKTWQPCPVAEMVELGATGQVVVVADQAC